MDMMITGAEKFARVHRELKSAPKELRSELTRGLTQAVKPLKKAAKDSARDILPSGGKLGQRVAKTQLAHKRRTGRNPSIRIEAKTNSVEDPLRIDRGRVRHPTFGHRPWVLQDVQPGWFTKPMNEGAPRVRKELDSVLDELARKIARST